MFSPFRHAVAAASLALWAGSSLFAQPAAPPEPPPAPDDAPAAPADRPEPADRPAPADNAAPAADAAAAEDVEVYTRGPLHEAFASPADDEPVVTEVVEIQPPEAIEELPPNERPEGDNIAWIPGYWAFDVDLNDFLWVSGLWRDVPPDRQWVPGYWTEVSGGWQWIPGMWTPVGTTEITYLPEPPPTQEHGPSSPAPGDDYFYIPGSWEYVQTDYQWRPGYWAPHQQNFIWTPARYHYTPAGYVFVPGFWDYGLMYRGLVYAPVAFRPRFRGPFTPTIAINTWNGIHLHLFVQPRFGTFLFGNYYGAQYASFGIRPWFAYHAGPVPGPLFGYYNWRYGPQYGTRMQRWYRYFAANVNAAPAVTFREQMRRAGRDRDGDDRININNRLAVRLDADPQDLPIQLAKVDDAVRENVRERTQNLRNVSQQRLKLETEGRADVSVDDRPADRPRDDQAKPGDRIQDRPGAGENRGPRKLSLDLPKVDRQPKAGVDLPEAPNELKDVRPDRADSEQPRIRGRIRGQGEARPNLDNDLPDIPEGAKLAPEDSIPMGRGPRGNRPNRGREGAPGRARGDNAPGQPANPDRPPMPGGKPRPGATPGKPDPTPGTPGKPGPKPKAGEPKPGANPSPAPGPKPGANPPAGGGKPGGGKPGGNPGAGKPGGGQPGAGNPGGGKPGGGNPGGGKPGGGKPAPKGEKGN